MKSREVHMIMLGPSRVGKSSLLATMYHEILQMRAGFKLEPKGTTREHLEEAYNNLKRVSKQLVFAPVEDLLKGTAGFIEHRFEVKFRDSTEFYLVFHDFRGGAMMELDSADNEKLCQKVAASRVIFNVLDAVSLMELDERMCEQRNGHKRVGELLDKAVQEGQEYLINFVLVKCESYIKTARGRDQLIKRFEKRHAPVLRLIEKNQSVVGLLIPVITLGCVEFREIDSNGNYVFERNRKRFQPRDVDQPLRYALGFALKHVDENRGLGEWIFGGLTGRGSRFAQALEDFCRDRKKPRKIYGNEKLLDVT